MNIFVEQKDSSKAGLDFGTGSTTRLTTFGRFITDNYDNDDSAANSYMNIQVAHAQQMLAGPLSRLTSDFSIPSWFLTNRLYSMNFWIGRADPTVGATSHLHHDYHDNLYCLVQGRKTLVLYGPDDTLNMYPTGSVQLLNEAGRINYDDAATHARRARWVQLSEEQRAQYIWGPHFSQLPAARWEQLSAEQRTKFPQAQSARRMECELVAGEILYLPAGWWHEVTSYGQSIAVNFWAEPPPPEEVARHAA